MSNSTRNAAEAGRRQPNESQRERTAIFVGVVLFGLVLGTFLPALSNGFVGFDDPDYVTENVHVQAGLTWESVQWAFRSTEAANWHPLTWLSHMLDCEFFGLASWGHHLTSILLHAVSATLLFLVLRRMTGATWRSFTVAMLFGLHPLRVESVAWVTERKDVLSALFWLLALWAYSRYAEGRMQNAECRTQNAAVRSPASRFTFHVSRYYFLSLIFFALGLMSKPMVVTLPCVLLLLDYWPLERFNHSRARTLVMEKTPFFPPARAGGVVPFVVQSHGGAVAGGERLPLGARGGNALISYCRYLGEMFWPTDLAGFYPAPGYWPMGKVLLAAALLLGISAWLFAQRRRYP